MLDIGGWEFMLVAFVLILVVGPKELPKMLRSFTRILQQVRGMAREFSDGMNDLAREADMADLKKVMDDAKSGNLDDIANALDGSEGSPLGSFTETLNETSGDLKSISKEAAATGDSLAAAANKDAPAQKPAKKPAQKQAKKAASAKAKPAKGKSVKAKPGKSRGA